jgi:hypothetical protein
LNLENIGPFSYYGVSIDTKNKGNIITIEAPFWFQSLVSVKAGSGELFQSDCSLLTKKKNDEESLGNRTKFPY